MATFSDSEIERHWHIWQMYRDGAVALIHRETILNQIIAELEDAGYLIHICDAKHGDKIAFEKTLRSILDFPAGRPDQTNLDALNDYLGDLEFPGCTGIVVVARHVQELHERDAPYLYNVMDIFAITSWTSLPNNHDIISALGIV